MKYFIVGLHASGKQEILNTLEGLGAKCGRLFSNIENPDDTIYNVKNYEFYTNQDINDVFENNAYVFIQELPLNHMCFRSDYKYYEGLSKYSFDQNQIFVLSPDQLLAIPPSTINEPICLVWVDNTKNNRSTRYHSEKRNYNYIERDKYERRDLGAFVKAVYSFNNSKLLYFNDEDPGRVAAIIYNTIVNPESLDLFTKYFN